GRPRARALPPGAVHATGPTPRRPQPRPCPAPRRPRLAAALADPQRVWNPRDVAGRRRRACQRGGTARAGVGRRRRPVQQHRLGDDDTPAPQARRTTADRNGDRQGIPDVSPRPWLTVRARLTLLYTGLFAVCGAIVVAVSYILVARLEPQGQGQQAPASFLAR